MRAALQKHLSPLRFALAGSALALAAAGWLAYLHGHLAPEVLIQTVKEASILAPVIFVLLFALSIMMLIPVGLPLNLGAGFLWGGVLGGALTTLGAAIAAIVSFCLSRYIAREWFLEKMRKRRLEHVLVAVQQNSWPLIFLLRINPIAPFGVMNYLLGLTPVTLGRYAAATIVSNAMLSFFFAQIGASLATLTLTQSYKSLLLQAGIAFTAITLLFGLKIWANARARLTALPSSLPEVS